MIEIKKYSAINICPNCSIEMGKITINEEYKWPFGGPLISVLGTRFQYRCPRCEYLYIKENYGKRNEKTNR